MSFDLFLTGILYPWINTMAGPPILMVNGTWPNEVFSRPTSCSLSHTNLLEPLLYFFPRLPSFWVNSVLRIDPLAILPVRIWTVSILDSVAHNLLGNSQQPNRKDLMKILAILCLCLSSQFAFALNGITSDTIRRQYNSEQIYKALKVKPVEMPSGNLYVKSYRKTVGGLTCYLHLNTLDRENSGSSCQMSSNENLPDFKAIYNALKVSEVSLSSSRPGSFSFIKAVGGLVCEKSGSIMQPQFSCTLH